MSKWEMKCRNKSWNLLKLSYLNDRKEVEIEQIHDRWWIWMHQWEVDIDCIEITGKFVEICCIERNFTKDGGIKIKWINEKSILIALNKCWVKILKRERFQIMMKYSKSVEPFCMCIMAAITTMFLVTTSSCRSYDSYTQSKCQALFSGKCPISCLVCVTSHVRSRAHIYIRIWMSLIEMEKESMHDQFLLFVLMFCNWMDIEMLLTRKCSFHENKQLKWN